MIRTPFVHIVTLIAFLASGFGPIPGAQADDFILPKPGVMVSLGPEFKPVLLKGLKIHPENPLRFDFILENGSTSLSTSEFKSEATKVIKYFLTSLTVPTKDLWVNLSPYEKDRIIPSEFGTTEMGKDFLTQDYLLKQITASLIYPESELGKKFWGQVYKKAKELYGSTDIPVNTFNKVWIVPDKAVVYTHKNMAYVVESHLKVMLEKDYLSTKHNLGQEGMAAAKEGENANLVDDLSTKILRQLVIPEIERAVNESKNFVQIRQIYQALILATWFKHNLQESLLAKVYVGRNRLQGIDLADKNLKEKIYERYLRSFKKGVYNFIKEDYDPITQQIVPRKYFSGGIVASAVEGVFKQENSDVSLNGVNVKELRGATVDLTAAMTANVVQMPVNSTADPLTLAISQKSTVTLRLNDERIISGQLLGIEGNNLVVGSPSFPANDFEVVDKKVYLPMTLQPKVITNVGETVNIEDYLSSLPKDKADEIRASYLSKNDEYIERQEKYRQESIKAFEEFRQALNKAVEKGSALWEYFNLMNAIFHAKDRKAIAEIVKAKAIVDRETEIMMYAKEMLGLIEKQDVAAQGHLSEVQDSVERLIELQQNSKDLRDVPLLMADGIVRTKVYHTPTEELDKALQDKFSTKEVDVVIVGAGPAGIAAALHFIALGQKVVVIDQGYASQSFSDAFMQSVHWMTSDARESSLVRDSFPIFEKMFGLAENLSLFRMRGMIARGQVEQMTGNKIFGMPMDSDSLNGARALKSKMSRNELYQHFLSALEYVAQHGLVQEQSAIEGFREENGKTIVTMRDGYQFVTRRIETAVGQVGTNAEFARESKFLFNLPGQYLTLGNRADLDNPEKRAALVEDVRDLKVKGALSKQLVITDPLLGSPEMLELMKALKSAPDGEKITVAVIGDGESAGKAVVELTNINPNVIVEFFPKRDLFITGDTLPESLYLRENMMQSMQSRPFIESSVKYFKTQNRGTGVQPQTFNDIARLKLQGRVRIHVLNNQYLDESTVEIEQHQRADGLLVTQIFTKLDEKGKVVINKETGEGSVPLKLGLYKREKRNDGKPGRYLLAEITGPIITAIGYNNRRSLPDKPVLKQLINSGIVSLAEDGSIQPVASDNNLTIGHESKGNNVYNIGPGLGPLTLFGGRVEEMSPRALLGALHLRGQDIVRREGAGQFITPYAAAAFRLSHPNDSLTEKESQLHQMVMNIVHDESFVRIMGEQASPRMVYQPVDQQLEIEGKPQFPVPVEIEPDTARLAYIDEALRKVANLELIPGIVSYFRDIDGFLKNFSDERMKAAGASQEFIDNVNALKKFHAANLGLDISDVVAHPGRSHKVIYMDPKDYEALFTERSTIRRNFMIETGGERLKMQPMIFQVLRHEFTHLIVNLTASEAEVNLLAHIDQEVDDFMRKERAADHATLAVKEKEDINGKGGIDLTNSKYEQKGDKINPFIMNGKQASLLSKFELNPPAGFNPFIIRVYNVNSISSMINSP